MVAMYNNMMEHTWWVEFQMMPSFNSLIEQPTEGSPTGKGGAYLPRWIFEHYWKSNGPPMEFDRAMVFMMAVLQRTSSVKKAIDVKACQDRRIQAWKDGKNDMIVQTAERDMNAKMTN